MSQRTSLFLGATLMIAGTSIGAVTLALPMATAALGMQGTALLLTLSWMLMTFTGLCIHEVQERLPSSLSFLSMAHQTLGRWGYALSCLSYALLLYALLAAYLSGGSDLIQVMHLDRFSSITLWALLGAGLLAWGRQALDGLNRLLMLGLGAAFLSLVVSGSSHWGNMLWHGTASFKPMLNAWPLIITAFGYQVILPSLRQYLGEHRDLLPSAIVVGTGLPWLLYLLWSCTLFAVLPHTGPHSLVAIHHATQPAKALVHALSETWQASHIPTLSTSFAFFALSSSFLGIVLSVYDLVGDAFQQTCMQSSAWRITWTLIPPLAWVAYDAQGFVHALTYASLFVVVLNIMVPMAMIIRLRFSKTPTPNHYQAPGGWWSLSLAGGLSLALLFASIEGLPGL